jgi:hypothetical protein
MPSERTGLFSATVACPYHYIYSWAKFPGFMTIFYCLSPEPLSLVGQVPIFISSRKRVDQFYAQALGSLFITTYSSQGYSGGIQTHLQMGCLQVLIV